jgi:hypothetical protein
MAHDTQGVARTRSCYFFKVEFLMSVSCVIMHTAPIAIGETSYIESKTNHWYKAKTTK